LLGKKIGLTSGKMQSPDKKNYPAPPKARTKISITPKSYPSSKGIITGPDKALSEKCASGKARFHITFQIKVVPMTIFWQ
jgi:hypothetical protein